MRRVLIVSPHFPPVNGADMHRVRLSLPYFAEFGWQPIVLAVRPEDVEGVQDPLLVETVPETIPVRRVRAIPLRWTRRVAVGALALRAYPFLLRAGAALISEHQPALVYFSTTVFPAMTLGRMWKRRFGVPYVLDMQDPWVSDYSQGKRGNLKSRLARSLHAVLEPWTMREAGGLMAVSADYISTLRRRYPWLADRPACTLPFGVSAKDFDLALKVPQPNRFFRAGDGRIHGAYVGRGGNDMARALRILFLALRRGLKERPELFSRVRLHFIGTDYAPLGRERKTIEPVARELGVGEFVAEHPLRVPYFEALQILLQSDFLTVPGSDDPQYTASKIYPYILAKKPLLAVFHRNSSVVPVLEATRSGQAVTFESETDNDEVAASLFAKWTGLLQALPFTPDTDWQAFEPYTAREMTRRQCELFDAVVAADVCRWELSG